MNIVPRQTLRRIIKKYGIALAGDARRCENLLKDLCGGYRREINLLKSAIDERVPPDLLAESAMPRQLLLHKLAKRLEDNLGMTQESARWAVDSWAYALEIVTEEEIALAEREGRSSSAPPAAPPVNSQILQTQPPERRAKSIPTSPPAPPVPPLLPPAHKPQNSPPPKSVPRGFPQIQTSAGGLNANAAPNPPLPVDPPKNVSASGKWLRRFFGCLLMLLLLIVIGLGLLFAVPYAIKVMRETQQSDAPRFPPR